MYTAGDTLRAENTLHFGPGSRAELLLQLSSPLSSSGHSSPPANPGILGVHPHPLNSATSALHIAIAATSQTATVSILDMFGRLVRHLPSPGAEGRTALQWDGRDTSGRIVAAGNYFIRMIDRGVVFQKPLLIVR
jgi:hypothetical protein